MMKTVCILFCFLQPSVYPLLAPQSLSTPWVTYFNSNCPLCIPQLIWSKVFIYKQHWNYVSWLWQNTCLLWNHSTEAIVNSVFLSHTTCATACHCSTVCSACVRGGREALEKSLEERNGAFIILMIVIYHSIEIELQYRLKNTKKFYWIAVISKHACATEGDYSKSFLIYSL